MKNKTILLILAFSETFQNKVDLADAYFEINDYKNAITYYEDALDNSFSKDTYVISKLIEAFYLEKKHSKVIQYYEELEKINAKINAKNQLQYGLSLDKKGISDLAEIELKKVDIHFSNYNERLVLAEYLIDKNKVSEAKEVLNESNHFTKDNRRIYKSTINIVKSLLKTI